MLFRAILPAFLLAAAFPDANTGASLPGRDRVQLASRGLAAVTRRHAHLAASETDSPEAPSHFLVLGKLPGYIDSCRLTFQSRKDVTIALQAVAVLYNQADDISYQIGDYQADWKLEAHIVAKFRVHTTNVFVALQALLITGRDVYRDFWDSRFRPRFTKFGVLIETIATVCIHLQIDFHSLLLGLNLDLNVFAGAGLELGRLGAGNLVN